MSQEIERKFLVKKIPPGLDDFPHVKLSQVYIESSNKDLEHRVRRQGDKYFYTIKTQGGMVRREDDKEIPQKDFEKLWHSVGPTGKIEKTRYFVPYDGKTIDLDVYEDRLFGLVVAEVEFPSLIEAKRFIAPEWFGTEVTEDKRYRNKNLAEYGFPK
jgi:CYTH domain-containing protein